MKPATRTIRIPRGVTLLEMTIVMLILLTLAGSALVINRRFGDWRKGREAAESLRTVYTAQRMFLADNPTVPVANITAQQVAAYLPNRPANLPSVKSLTGQTLQIRVNVSPPVIDAGGTNAYDPSPSRTDNLWDVGE